MIVPAVTENDPCTDRDRFVSKWSRNRMAGCPDLKARSICEDARLGSTAKKLCPASCGVCIDVRQTTEALRKTAEKENDKAKAKLAEAQAETIKVTRALRKTAEKAKGKAKAKLEEAQSETIKATRALRKTAAKEKDKAEAKSAEAQAAAAKVTRSLRKTAEKDKAEAKSADAPSAAAKVSTPWLGL